MRFFIFALLGLGISALRADPAFRSGPARVSLLELYTSEGCSSCPPAEEWLGRLREAPGLWKEFVPVALHVNYWDKLGWRDALATPEFTAREYAYAAAWRAKSVYTPCFVRDGAEWHPRENAIRARHDSPGLLELAREANDTWRIVFEPHTKREKSGAPYVAYVALLGGGIVNHVRAGENAGRALQHEFVLLRLEHSALAADRENHFSARVTLHARTDIAAPRHAIAAWIAEEHALAPLQATGGWLE